jgi:predicted DNA-binding protein (UPF0278 family)
VNSGRNPEIMRRSNTLYEYSAFVAKVRENINTGLKSAKALEKAVKDCVKNNILKEFLERYGSDVMGMLSTEFNLDDAKRVWLNDGEMNRAEKIAEKLLRNGMTKEFVSENTELSMEQVKEIAQKIKNEQAKL